MSIACFTSISFSYLAKARVLAHSLKRHHPSWSFIVCITDLPPQGLTLDVNDEAFDEIIWAHDLNINHIHNWIFKHDVVEICTAVKGPLLEQLTTCGYDKIFYLDPDIAVFSPLTPMVEWLEEHSILLTPHQVTPDETYEAIIDNEICSLVHGIYNLGFVAIRNDQRGRAFAAWWSSRLREFCYDDKPMGLFVDQKWCNHVPSMFDGVKIVRDPGYNVASWNISQRNVKIEDSGDITVNCDHILRFFHFTKLGVIGDTMTARYAKDNASVYELWAWYKNKVIEFSDQRIPDGYWHYGTFDNGVTIPKSVRVLFRNRRDLQQAFPNPYLTHGNTYYRWLHAEGLI